MAASDTEADADAGCVALPLVRDGKLNSTYNFPDDGAFKFTATNATVSVDGFADTFTPDASKCYDLTIPATVQHSGVDKKVQIKSQAFNASKVHFGTLTISADISGNGWASFKSTTIDNLVIADGVTGIYASSDNSGGIFQQAKIGTVSIADSVKTIGNAAFRGATIGEMATGNGVTELNTNAFGDANTWGAHPSIGSLTVGKSVKSIGAYAFYKSGLKELAFADRSDGGENTLSFGTDGDGLSNAFVGTGLTSVAFPNGLTELTIGGSAFQNVSSLTKVTYPDTLAKLTIGGSAFQGTKLDSVAFPDSVSDLEIRASAFEGVPISSVTFPSKTMSALNIGENAFMNSGVQTVAFPSEVTGDLTIESQAFQGSADKLKDVTLPGTVGGNLTLGNWSFYHLDSTNSITGEFKLYLPTEVKGTVHFGDPAPTAITSSGDSVKFRSVVVAPENVTTAKDEYWGNYQYEGNMFNVLIVDRNDQKIDFTGVDGTVFMTTDLGDGARGPKGFSASASGSSAYAGQADGLTYDSDDSVWTSGKSFGYTDNDGWTFEGIDIYCTTDSGKTWTKCTNEVAETSIGTSGAGNKWSTIIIKKAGSYREMVQWETKTYKLDFGNAKVENAPDTYTTADGIATLPTPASEAGKVFRGWTWKSGIAPSGNKTYSNPSTPVMTIQPKSIAGDLTMTPVFVDASTSAKLDELKAAIDAARALVSTSGYVYKTDKAQAFIEARNAANTLYQSASTDEKAIQEAIDKLNNAVKDLQLVKVAPVQNGGTITIPSTQGAVYSVDSQVVTGTVNVPSGSTVKITGALQSGWSLTKGTGALDWSFSYSHTSGGGSTSPKPDPEPVSCSFSDVSASTPHRDDICWLAAEGIATGYADGT
ncbi:leucine-rich repeat protein, partial [Bifidobacterium miconisargentati]|uniref:leucine-rich repeat protein n=1 Tax=Bifidobacterium miconisargentati TaxID=2834437 RepID=UPI001BDC788D|nr:leucine-rich repeat protein [Bifidobacterium miconisargentati]